ncbi:MAG: ABC transporter permease [Bacteroidota bacterium]|nr:ABC transporter permease [Bacteroidota bacterium]
MFKYIGKRILLFIPTLFIITLLGFVIAINAPGDPVEKLVSSATQTGDLASNNSAQKEQKLFWRKKLGLDLPVFYMAVSSLSRPDTLYKVYEKEENQALERLITEYGNWSEISAYYLSCHRLYDSLASFKPDTTMLKEFAGLDEQLNQLRFESLALSAAYEGEVIASKFKKMNDVLAKYPFFKSIEKQLKQTETHFAGIKANSSVWKNYIPAIDFYGVKNQYHRWLFGDGEFSKGIFRFDFGISYQTKMPISEVIKTKIGWSLLFTCLSVFLAYLISIPIGVRAAQKRGGLFDRASSLVLFMLYSLPGFFVAFLLMLLLANPNMFSVLPASGVKPAEGYPEGASFFECVKISLPYVILPLICYTYSSFAFLARIMRGAMVDVIEQDYIRTARAKGLTEKKVTWKHAFRNSLFPIITVFASIFPMAIGGSVILETIFTIPGMGLEVFNAITFQNYPMIIAITTLTGFLTLVGILISDILYAVVDPRISYS